MVGTMVERKAKALSGRVTKTDLAFVDAAIAMYKASQVNRADGPSLAIGDPAACDIVDVVALVAAAAVVAYHLYNSCLVGEENEILVRARNVGLEPTVSLERLIAAREDLAAALGVESSLRESTAVAARRGVADRSAR